MSKQGGFTLTELLLSIAIIGIITGLSIPFYQSYISRSDLANTVESVATAARRANQYARGVKDDSTWGVYVQTGSITIFKGASYAARDTAADEIIDLPESITIESGGITETLFAKMTGSPTTTGTITLANNTNDTRVINLNAKGLVSY